MTVPLLIILCVVIGFVILMKITIVKISKHENVSRLAWIPSVVSGLLWLFFIVFAQIKASEAEKETLLARTQAEENRLAAEAAQRTAAEYMARCQTLMEEAQLQAKQSEGSK